LQGDCQLAFRTFTIHAFFVPAKVEGSSYINHFLQPDTIAPGGPQGLNRYAYVLNNPINANDPSGHKCVGELEECKDNGKPINAAGKRPVVDKPKERKPGDPRCKGKSCDVVKDVLTAGSFLLDGASLIASGAEAIVADSAYVAAGAACVASEGAGCGPAFGLAWGVDYALAGAFGGLENALSISATVVTGVNDYVSGNTGIDPAIGMYIGKDTIVSSRNSLAGLLPESNIDALVSVSQFKYDIDRITGNKSGGYVPVMAMDTGWKSLPPFSREFVRQALFKDWW
jgi:hypothetical protein